LKERERGREGEREKGREEERGVLVKGTLTTILLKRSLPTSRTVLHITKAFP